MAETHTNAQLYLDCRDTVPLHPPQIFPPLNRPCALIVIVKHMHLDMMAHAQYTAAQAVGILAQPWESRKPLVAAVCMQICIFALWYVKADFWIANYAACRHVYISVSEVETYKRGCGGGVVPTAEYGRWGE